MNWGKGKYIMIHTDSAYAFNTVHVFAAQWRNRGMVTTMGLYGRYLCKSLCNSWNQVIAHTERDGYVNPHT